MRTHIIKNALRWRHYGAKASCKVVIKALMLGGGGVSVVHREGFKHSFSGFNQGQHTYSHVV